MNGLDLFAYVVALRGPVLDTLLSVPEEVLTREMRTNHHSILQTLIHIMVVEQSWITEDLRGEPQLSWDEFRARYLPRGDTIEGVITGWQEITRGTVRQVAADDPRRVIEFPGPSGTQHRTVEQIMAHLAGEEMIHMGEVLAMTRQQGIDLPAYYLLIVQDAGDAPWEALVASSSPQE